MLVTAGLGKRDRHDTLLDLSALNDCNERRCDTNAPFSRTVLPYGLYVADVRGGEFTQYGMYKANAMYVSKHTRRKPGVFMNPRVIPAHVLLSGLERKN